MTISLADLWTLLGPWPVISFAVFLRLGAATFFLPVFGEVAVSVRVKLAAVLAFTVIVAPVVAQEQGRVPEWSNRLFLTEVAVGLLIGFALRLMVFALRTAGSIAAQSTSLSQLLGGAGVEPQPAISTALTMSGLALAALLGLHVHLAAMFIWTFEAVPIGSFFTAEDLAGWGVSVVAASFALAFSLSLPFVAAALLYNLALGVINRAMPQMMVAFVGAPAITLGTLALMILCVPIILTVWIEALYGRLLSPLGLPR